MELERVLPHDDSVYADPDTDSRYDVIQSQSKKERSEEHPYVLPIPAAWQAPSKASTCWKTFRFHVAAVILMTLITIVAVTGVVMYFNYKLDLQTKQFMGMCEITKIDELKPYTLQHKQQSKSSKTCQKNPNVIFSAGLTTNTLLQRRTVVKYDKVFVNKGPMTDPYNPLTGMFTSPVTGFYFFQLNAVNAANVSFTLELRKNNKRVIMIYPIMKLGYKSTSNSVELCVAKGDQVRVVPFIINSIKYSGVATFNGYLISEFLDGGSCPP